MKWLLGGAGTVFVYLACFFVFAMPAPWAVAWALLAGLGILLLVSDRRRPAKAQPGLHGWTEREISRALKDGQGKVTRIRRLRKTMADPALRAKIEAVCDVADRIFVVLRADPRRIPKARTFLEQYLDTTALIVQRYADLSAQGARNPDVQRLLAAFADLLDTVQRTFQKQHDKLLAENALDLDAEITVLKKMMDLEGV